MSILVIDSDNLKQVNDQHGHKFGDALLLMIVKCIQDQLRDTDILARFGGDEFVVLLPEAPASGAQLVADRILLAVQNTLPSIEEKSIKGTVSIGIATFPDDGMSINMIVESADKAMYKAKEAGRNKVVKFSTHPAP
jgi:diguanylate cyclase (GGDEF)-like protein